VPIFAFAVIACNIKIRAPNAHTVLEIVRARWGDRAHKVFFCFAITTNVVVTAMLLLGGASVLNALTGMNRYAACMLIPIGVVVKTTFGGLKITYFSSVLSTWIILAVVAVFSVRVFATHNAFLGSPGEVWENLNTFASMPKLSNQGADVAQMRLGPVDGTLLPTLRKHQIGKFC
jgi:Na+/proline symporter